MNKKLFLGMLVCLLVFGLMFVGCDTDNGGDSSNDSGGLTITGLDSLDGKYVWAYSDESSGRLMALVSLSSTTYQAKAALVSNGKAVLNVYAQGDRLPIYKGSVANAKFQIFEIGTETFSIVGADTGSDTPFTVTVSFENGVASGVAISKN
jgi:hypothetical protein